jgi:hypothetical protein
MADPGLWDAAQANIAVKYDPQQAALQRQLELSQKNTASSEQAIQGFGNTGRTNIGTNFATLYGLLGANKTDTQNALNQQVDLTNQGYDQAIKNIQGYQQGSRDYIAQMAAALGQSGQGLVSSGKLEDVANQQLGYAQGARTNYGSTLSDWVAKMGSLADMGIASAHQNEALKLSGFESDLLNMLGQNKLAGTTQETDVINKIADLMNVRQSDLVDMYNQLVAAQWQRDFEQAKLNEQASEHAASLANARDIAAMQESGANSRAAAAKDDSLDWAKFNEGVRQFNLGREDTASSSAATNAFNEREFQAKYPGTGDPSALTGMIDSGLISANDPGAANAWLTGGPQGLQTYNSNQAGLKQVQDMLQGLGRSVGGGDGFWGTRNTNGDPWGWDQAQGVGNWVSNNWNKWPWDY